MLLKCEKGQNLTPTEQTAIDYINQNIEVISYMTISEIADQAYVSAPTISRAIRKCGIDKLPDIRKKIALKEIAKENYVVNDIFEKSYRECKKTIEQMDTTTILKVVDHICKAKKIFILAHGHTRLAAQEFAEQLQWQGYNACVQSDLNAIKRIAMLTKPGDLVIVFSIACSAPELVTGTKRAKDKGVTIVSCCCTKGTPLEEVSDVAIIGYNEIIVSKNGFGSTSLLGLQIIGRSIVEYIIREM